MPQLEHGPHVSAETARRVACDGGIVKLSEDGVPCWYAGDRMDRDMAVSGMFQPRSRLFLRDVRDTEDRTVYGTEMAQSGTINGHRFFQTNNIPNNLGGGSNESLVILVDASEVVIGDVQQVSVDRSGDAMISIDGQDVSLFQSDMSAIRVRQWNDLILRHDVSASVIEAVKWGA